eukprot:gene379-692_t
MPNMNEPVQFGVTPPVSFAGPSPIDIQINQELDTYLTKEGVFETQSGQLDRERVVNELQALVRAWVESLGKRKGYSQDIYANGGNSTLLLFGSQRLEVHTPDADIDILCITPEYATREEFFSIFCKTLSSQQGITNLSPLPDAYTPLLKFEFYNQSVDMIFVSLCINRIPSDLNILDNNYLRGLDEQSIRSLNGCRVAEILLQLIPKVNTFRMTLRAIKLWARRRGLYSNVLGFLGGINYAILVAFVCQKYINANPATLIQKFFLIFSNWRWPTPVLLTKIDEITDINKYNSNIYIQSWNSKSNPKDKMPIITPAYPAMNSAYNVGAPQLRILQEEIQRGKTICYNYTKNSSSNIKNPFPWNEIFESSIESYFNKYPRYIQLDIISSDRDKHKRWLGWCESRMRGLSIALDDQNYIKSHPHSFSFHQIKEKEKQQLQQLPQSQSSNKITVQNEEFITSFFLGLSFTEGIKTLDATDCIQNFLHHIASWRQWEVGMDIQIFALNRTNIPSFINISEDIFADDIEETQKIPTTINSSNPNSSINMNVNISNTSYNNNNNNNEFTNAATTKSSIIATTSSASLSVRDPARASVCKRDMDISMNRDLDGDRDRNQEQNQIIIELMSNFLFPVLLYFMYQSMLVSVRAHVLKRCGIILFCEKFLAKGRRVMVRAAFWVRKLCIEDTLNETDDGFSFQTLETRLGIRFAEITL